MGRGELANRRKGEVAERMEIRLQSGKLIIVEADRLEEIWKLRGFLTEEEMKQVETAVKAYEKLCTCG